MSINEAMRQERTLSYVDKLEAKVQEFKKSNDVLCKLLKTVQKELEEYKQREASQKNAAIAALTQGPTRTTPRR